MVALLTDYRHGEGKNVPILLPSSPFSPRGREKVVGYFYLLWGYFFFFSLSALSKREDQEAYNVLYRHLRTST